MTTSATFERLETNLTRLIEKTLTQKGDQIDFLIGLNRLDDLLLAHQAGKPIADDTAVFLDRYRHWRDGDVLGESAKKRLGGFLSELLTALKEEDSADSLKLAEEVKAWLRSLGDGSFRLTLKRPAEKMSLTDSLKDLMRREMEYFDGQVDEYEHVLTFLDDVLKSAEAKTDMMYRHLAASIIYFLQMEGYKVDPYITRLRRLRTET
jgi:hypothetical protein